MKAQISHRRHVVKTVTWRIIGTLDTICLAWLISGDPLLGLSVGGAEMFTKMFLYYLHERVWYLSDFGIERKEKN